MEIGDLEVGVQYYALQWKQGEGWYAHSRDLSLPTATALYDILKSSEGFEWRIVYVTEMIRVINNGDM